MNSNSLEMVTVSPKGGLSLSGPDVCAMEGLYSSCAGAPRSKSQLALQWHLDKINVLEQMLQSLPTDCMRNVKSGWSFSRKCPDGSTLYVHAHCNMMTCRTCSRRRVMTAISSISEAVCRLGLNTHVILTLPPDVAEHRQEKRLVRACRRLRVNLARKCGGDLSYVWSFGGKRNAALHLHMLLNVSFSKAKRSGVNRAWLTRSWHRLTGAQQVKVTEFGARDARKLAFYLMTNVMETVVGGHALKRRFASSRDIKLIDRPVSSDGLKIWERVIGPTARYGLRNGTPGIHDVLNGNVLVPATLPVVAGGEEMDVSMVSRGGGGDAPLAHDEELSNGGSANQSCLSAHEGFVSSQVAGVCEIFEKGG